MDENSVGAPESPAVSPNSPNSTISLADGGAMLKAAAFPEITSGRRRPARVMVVEDNAINRRVLTAFLKKHGFEHMEAVNGAAGVELFDGTPPDYWDVILMDITMPVMNGYDATRSIRRIESARRFNNNNNHSHDKGSSAVNSPTMPSLNPLSSHAKIFALTGLATVDDKRQAFDSGVDGFLVKPVSLASLDLLFKSKL
jgi:CheY-like chemotaxis protein